jgi:dephospho-CoA kinase
MRVVGLTGGIASGKSTVARMFAELGAPIVDADQLARDVVEPGSDGLAAIVARFGAAVLEKDGRLDRKKLGELVFADARARADLEAILHPRIAAESQRQIAAHAEAGAGIVLYEAALIVENGLHRGLGGLIVVAVPPAVQIARLMARDGLDRAACEARLAAQLPLADKIAAADHVIDNAGSLAATLRQVAGVWETMGAA